MPLSRCHLTNTFYLQSPRVRRSHCVEYTVVVDSAATGFRGDVGGSKERVKELRALAGQKNRRGASVCLAIPGS